MTLTYLHRRIHNITFGGNLLDALNCYFTSSFVWIEQLTLSCIARLSIHSFTLGEVEWMSEIHPGNVNMLIDNVVTGLLVMAAFVSCSVFDASFMQQKPVSSM